MNWWMRPHFLCLVYKSLDDCTIKIRLPLVINKCFTMNFSSIFGRTAAPFFLTLSSNSSFRSIFVCVCLCEWNLKWNAKNAINKKNSHEKIWCTTYTVTDQTSKCIHFLTEMLMRILSQAFLVFDIRLDYYRNDEKDEEKQHSYTFISCIFRMMRQNYDSIEKYRHLLFIWIHKAKRNTLKKVSFAIISRWIWMENAKKKKTKWWLFKFLWQTYNVIAHSHSTYATIRFYCACSVFFILSVYISIISSVSIERKPQFAFQIINNNSKSIKRARQSRLQPVFWVNRVCAVVVVVIVILVDALCYFRVILFIPSFQEYINAHIHFIHIDWSLQNVRWIKR